MNTPADREEDRLHAFLNTLFALNCGAAGYLLIVVPWINLPIKLPFTLASFPLKCQVETLATLAALIIVIRLVNIFCHAHNSFQRLMKAAACVLTVLTFFAVVWTWISLLNHPEYLLH